LAKLTVIRCASSRERRFHAHLPLRLILEVEVPERLPGRIADDEALRVLIDRPRWRKAARGRHGVMIWRPERDVLQPLDAIDMLDPLANQHLALATEATAVLFLGAPSIPSVFARRRRRDVAIEAGSTTWLSIPSLCSARSIQNPSRPAS
jgi:hypothetical protein